MVNGNNEGLRKEMERRKRERDFRKTLHEIWTAPVTYICPEAEK